MSIHGANPAAWRSSGSCSYSSCSGSAGSAPAAEQQKGRQESSSTAGACRRGGGGGRGSGVLRRREPAGPGGSGAAHRGELRLRGPGVRAALRWARGDTGFFRRIHGIHQLRPPVRHRRHLRRGLLRRRGNLAPGVEGAAIPLQQGVQLLPPPAAAAGAATADRVWPRLRGACCQARGAGAAHHQGCHVDPRALSKPCQHALAV